MMVSAKEKRLLAVTAVFMLYAAVAFQLRPRLEAIEGAIALKRDKERLLGEYENLIAQSADWENQYAQKASLMPVFGMDRQVQTHWLAMLDGLASTNGLSVIRRQAGEEKPLGDVYEMEIECKEWEGDLPSLVSFLRDINEAGAMLDVKRMHIRPGNGKSSHLRGSFTLSCAYMRSPAEKDTQQ